MDGLMINWAVIGFKMSLSQVQHCIQLGDTACHATIEFDTFCKKEYCSFICLLIHLIYCNLLMSAVLHYQNIYMTRRLKRWPNRISIQLTRKTSCTSILQFISLYYLHQISKMALQPPALFLSPEWGYLQNFIFSWRYQHHLLHYITHNLLSLKRH